MSVEEEEEVIGLLPNVERYISTGYLPDRASVARFGESLPWRALLYIMASIVHGCSGILRSRYSVRGRSAAEALVSRVKP